MPGSQDCLPSTGADPSGFAIVAVLAVVILDAIERAGLVCPGYPGLTPRTARTLGALEAMAAE